jgi:putative CocE/NonD family hydrolase
MNKPQLSAHKIILTTVVTLTFLMGMNKNALPAESNTRSTPRILCGVKVPLRDSINLNATVYMPAAVDAPLPVVLTVTPYISDSYHKKAMNLVEHGYVFVAVDSRGRGNSEGVLNPMFQEANDVYDVVEWIAKQPWSNGRIGMSGGSYTGHNQWAGAKLQPPHLATILPVAAPFVGYDWPKKNNIEIDITWDAFTHGVTLNRFISGDIPYWIKTIRELYLNNQSFSSLYEWIGIPSSVFTDWISRRTLGDWEGANPSDAEFAAIDIPILTITGYYDSVQKGALEMYRRHTLHATGEAAKRHFVVIGPWGHAETRGPKKELGGLTFGDASLIDMNALDAAWYDWTLKDGNRPEFLKDRIAYFLAGGNKWKYAESLPAIADFEQVLYLNSTNGRADNLYAGGSLDTTPPSSAQPDSYVYDPRGMPGDDAPAPWWWVQDLANQPHITHIDGNGVIYHSAVFDNPTEITGNVRVDAWIALDVPDTDFVVSLYEVLSDGTSVLLAADMKRARYRDSLYEETLAEPGKVYHFVFDTFNFFSRLVAKGSRLRLVLTGQHSLMVERNFNGGGVVAEETMLDAQPATVTLYHDKRHPSSLTLPIVNNDK